MLEHSKDPGVRCLLWPAAQNTYRDVTPPSTDSASDSADSDRTVEGAPLGTGTGPSQRTRCVHPGVYSRSSSPGLESKNASYMRVTATSVKHEPSYLFRFKPAGSCCVAQEKLDALEARTSVQQAHVAMSMKCPTIPPTTTDAGPRSSMHAPEVWVSGAESGSMPLLDCSLMSAPLIPRDDPSAYMSWSSRNSQLDTPEMLLGQSQQMGSSTLAPPKLIETDIDVLFAPQITRNTQGGGQFDYISASADFVLDSDLFL